MTSEVMFLDHNAYVYEAMLTMLRRHGDVEVRERTHPRYVGAKIGIYNPAGEKVGVPGPSHVVERLFVLHKALAG